MSNSVKPQFSFGTKVNDKEDDIVTTEEKVQPVAVSPVEGEDDKDLDLEYVDRRTVEELIEEPI